MGKAAAREQEAGDKVPLLPGAAQMIWSLAKKHGMNLGSAWCEMIDNSFDASASHVWIVDNASTTREMSIEDDGCGTDDPAAIVTPFKHGRHRSTRSGRYGIGGTVAQIYLTDGLGAVEVRSRTAASIHVLTVDYREMRDQNELFAVPEPVVPNFGEPTGTKIALSGCIKHRSDMRSKARDEVEYLFGPALRNGKRITITTDGQRHECKPYPQPELVTKVAFEFEVDGCKVAGFCGLTRPGALNRARGFAVIFGHRVMGNFSEPIGDRSVDLGRIYGEILLPPDWQDINDLKNGFRVPPEELWAKVEEACAELFNRAEQERREIELSGAISQAQSLLDAVAGYTPGGIKGRRGGAKQKTGAVEPTGAGSEHQNFSKTQPGNKRLLGCRANRIKIDPSSSLDLPFEIRVETTFVRVSINQNDPNMQPFLQASAGDWLARQALLAVASDMVERGNAYAAMFPDVAIDTVAEVYGRLLDRLPRAAPARAVA